PQSHSQAMEPRTWQNRLMLSTSGLGVAMSEESLRRLTYCLRWLRWANERLGNHVVSLKQLLEEYEAGWAGSGPGVGAAAASTTARGEKMTLAIDGAAAAAAAALAPTAAPPPYGPQLLHQQIQRLKTDVLSTLKHVVDVVSRYAGAALSENARALVRRHLTSLPQRFRHAAAADEGEGAAAQAAQAAQAAGCAASSASASASASAPGKPSLVDATAASARRVIVLAEEGLDIMMQVSRVVNDTLASAETWCQRLRMPRASGPDGAGGDGDGDGDGDIDVEQGVRQQSRQQNVQALLHPLPQQQEQEKHAYSTLNGAAVHAQTPAPVSLSLNADIKQPLVMPFRGVEASPHDTEMTE
ncbi:hypothetical protein KEM52_002660, partial [Ascosphaera acerosa]